MVEASQKELHMTDHQRFIVIRHGESQTNATDTFQAGNQTDLDPLTTLGMEDARRLAERLAELPVDVIVSSSYLRARSTAGAIADATGAPHVVPVWKGSSWVDLPAKDPELRDHVSLFREIDVPSELRGLRFDDPRAQEIQHAALSVADQPDVHYSDEENLYDLWRRAEEMRRYLEARTERLIVVVAHGGINKVWLAHLMFTAVAGLDTPTQLAASARLVGQHWSAVSQLQPATGVDVADDRHSASSARVFQLHAKRPHGCGVPPRCRSRIPRRRRHSSAGAMIRPVDGHRPRSQE